MQKYILTGGYCLYKISRIIDLLTSKFEAELLYSSIGAKSGPKEVSFRYIIHDILEFESDEDAILYFKLNENQ